MHFTVQQLTGNRPLASLEIRRKSADANVCVSFLPTVAVPGSDCAIFERVYIYNHSLMESGGNFKRSSHGKVLLICFIITEEGCIGAKMSYCQNKEPYHVDIILNISPLSISARRGNECLFYHHSLLNI